MKVFWVLGYDGYYPNSDNFMASFATIEEAQAYADSKPSKYPESDDELSDMPWSKYDHYQVIDISDRL
jgi:hypothetical protein